MRKIALITAIALACGLTACQSRINPQPAESTMVQGCVSGTPGNLTLVEDNGRVYQLSQAPAELGKHVGEQVVIRGNKVSSSREPGAPAEASSKGVPDRIDVTSVQATSQKCAAKK